MCNNLKPDLVRMNADIKFGESLTIGSQDIELKQNFGANQDHNSGTILWKMPCNNPRLDPVNMNAYKKLVKICQ